ncbi:MAG: hypothetical protein AAF629_25275 [Chloroflexota bacterium]
MKTGGEYKNDKKHGPWIMYYANGNKRSEGTYDEGIKVGEWRLYHKNGTLSSEATFVNGKYTGYYCSYHDNGEKFREGYYNAYTGKSSDGTKDGEWTQYDRDGNIEHVNVYKRGSKVKPT